MIDKTPKVMGERDKYLTRILTESKVMLLKPDNDSLDCVKESHQHHRNELICNNEPFRCCKKKLIDD